MAKKHCVPRAAKADTTFIPIRTESPTQMADRLIVDKSGFTLDQLRAAIAKLLTICPSTEILSFYCVRNSSYTNLSLECSLEDAARLVGPAALPEAPSRVCRRGTIEVRRRRDKKIRIDAQLAEDDASVVGDIWAFTAVEVRKLVPYGPRDVREWKQNLRDSLEDTLNFPKPGMIEAHLRVPVTPQIAPRDPEAHWAELTAVNSRFRIRECDIQHLIALYSKLQNETVKAMLAALDAAIVEDLSAKPSAQRLKLVVNNT